MPGRARTYASDSRPGLGRGNGRRGLLRRLDPRRIERLPVWAAVCGLLLMAGGAAGVGPVLAGVINGNSAVTAGQAIVVDRENFTSKDVRRSIDEKVVTFNDDGTTVTVAGEFHVGETFVVDVPLANRSNSDANGIAELNASPGLQVDVDPFWRTRTRSDSPAVQTALITSPVYVTGITPQPSDTLASSTTITGAAGISAQPAVTTGTLSSPNLPASTPQARVASPVAVAPGSTHAITPKSAVAASTNTLPSGVPTSTVRNFNGSTVHSQPAGSAAITPRAVALSQTYVAPSGLATNTPQSVNGTQVLSAPAGVPAITPQGMSAVSTNSQPSGSAAISAQAANSTLTNSQPAGVVAVTPQLADSTRTTTQPAGAPAATPQAVSLSQISLQPNGLPAITPQAANATRTTTQSAGIPASTPRSGNGTPTTIQPAGAPTAAPQTADSTRTTVQPSGVPTSTSRPASATLTYTQPSGAASIQPLTANATAVTSAPAGISSTPASRPTDSTPTTTQPSGSVPITAQTSLASSGAQPAGSSSATASWTVQTANAENADWISLTAVDASNAYISYRNTQTSAHQLRFAKTTNGGSSWSVATAYSNSNHNGQYSSIAAPSASVIYISFWDSTMQQLRVIKSTDSGGNWSQLGGFSVGDNNRGNGAHSAIAAADTNTVYVVYDDNANGQLRVIKTTNGGANWDNQYVDGAHDPEFASIAAVDTSTVFVSYHLDYATCCARDLHYSKTTSGGSSWTGGQVDGPANLGLSINTGQYTSISAVSASTAFISYYDADNQDLKFAKTINGGSSWTKSTVDSAGCVGQWTSIEALDASNIYISYQDCTNFDLKLAQSVDGGATWTISTLDSAGNVGEHTSIEMVDSTHGFIAYRDSSSSRLKVATLAPVGSSIYYPGTFTLDTDGNGYGDDTVNFVAADFGGDSTIDRLELSIDDTTYGETTSGTLSDGITGTDNDEYFDYVSGTSASRDVRLGTHLFTVSFNRALSSGKASVSVASKQWYTGSGTIDADGGGVANDAINFALSDSDSDGAFDTLDLSLGDTTYGQATAGTLTDNDVDAGTDDERITYGSGGGILAWWKGNGDGTDSTGNGNTLTLANGATFEPGMFGQALSLDGVGAYATAGSSINLANSSFTIDFWARRDSINTEDYVISQGSSGTGLMLHIGFRLDNTFTCAFFNNDLNTAAAYTDNGWHHWACTYNSSTGLRRIFRDGVLVASDTATGNYTGSGVLNIGNHVFNGAKFDGAIDDVRIASTQFGLGRVTSLYNRSGWDQDKVFGTSDLTFTVGFDAVPAADTDDLRITSKTYFTGTFAVDLDADGSADDAVNFALSDEDSDGLYGKLDLSSDDTTYREGTAGNLLTGTNDDETVTSSGDVTLGAYYRFNITFDANPTADTSDAALSSKTWFTGSTLLDTDGDGDQDDTVNFVLSDADSDGLYSGAGDRIDLSIGTDSAGTTFGQNVSGPTDASATADGTSDARIAPGSAVDLGAYGYLATGASAPPTSGTDLSLTLSTWFTGTLALDVSGDGVLDDLNYVLSDPDFDGHFDILDLSLGDTTFGQTTGGTLTDLDIDAGGDDERISVGSSGSLAGWWKADGDATDSSGNGNHGTLQGGATFATGYVGQAFSLDGIDDGIRPLGSASGSLNIAGQAITVAAWVNVTSLGITGTTIFDKFYDGSVNGYYFSLDGSGRPAFYAATTGAQASVAGSSSVVGAGWKHVAATYDGTAARLYVDGTQVASALASGNILPTNYAAAIGNDNGGSTDYGIAGLIDDVRVYSSALTVADVQALFADSSWHATIVLGASDLSFDLAFATGPVAATSDVTVTVSPQIWYTGSILVDADSDGTVIDTVYFALSDTDSDGLYDVLDLSLGDTTFGETTGGNLSDLDLDTGGDDERVALSAGDISSLLAWWKGNGDATDSVGGFNGVLTNGASIGAGQFDQAFTFDGVNDYVSVSPAPNFANAAFTVSVWAQRLSNNNDFMLGQGSPSTNNGLLFGFENSNTFNFAFYSNDLKATSGVGETWHSDGLWHMFTGTYNAATNEKKIYVDGVEKASHFAPADYSGSGALSINSAVWNSGEGLQGSLDDVRIYGIALTAAAVQELYNSTGSSTTATANITVGSSDLRFAIAFDNAPAADSNDARLTSKTWYTNALAIDADGNGTASDNANFVIWDSDSDGVFDTLDVSIGSDSSGTTFGQNLGGATDTSATANGSSDARITATSDVQLGAYTFSVTFTSTPVSASPDLTATSKSWFTGMTNLDADGDGNASDDNIHVALSDTNSDGLFETLDVTINDGANGFGNGTLADSTASADGTDDIRTSSASSNMVLGNHQFAVSFDSSPDGASDLTLASGTWFTGSLIIANDADGIVNDTVSFVLLDLDSNGVYETLDISTDDFTFGEGTLAGQSPLQTGSNDDERLIVASDVRLGASLTFNVAFDNAPLADTDDVRITSRTWFTGAFTLDVDADSAADDAVNFVLSDANSDGAYDTLDMSSDNTTYGEGSLSGQSPRQTGAGDDERITASADIRLGPNYLFSVGFDSAPLADTDDARVTSKTWFTGTMTTDADAGGVADDTVNVALSDANSDGLYDTADLSLADATFGQTTGGSLSDGKVESNNDERLSSINTAGLIAWWRGDGDATDSIGGFGGTLQNGATFGAGQFDQAFAFDGVDDYVSINPSPNFAGSSFTVSAWVKRLSSDNDFILGQWSGSGSDNSNRLHFGYRGGAAFTFAFWANDLDVNTGISNQDWHLYTGTYDSATNERRIYVDGALTGSDIAGADYTGSGPLTINSVPWSSSQGLNGSIDDVRIYSIALTATEVQSLYSAGSGPSSSSNSNLAFGSAQLPLAFAFDPAPPAATQDASLTARARYTGIFEADVNADGALETINFALSDSTSDGVYDVLDLSLGDATFGQTTGGTLTDLDVDTGGDDERLAVSGQTVVFGSANIAFITQFDPAPAEDSSDVRIISKTWYTGAVNLDADGDGSASDDTAYFVLSDSNSDGLFESLDATNNDGTNGFGHGTLDASAAPDGSDDIRTVATTSNLVLGTYQFETSFDTSPEGTSDLTLRADSWFTGSLQLDADADASAADDTVYFAIIDTNTDGVYDTLDITINDGPDGFGHGTLDGTAGATGSDDIRTGSLNSDLILGTYQFAVTFTNNPGVSDPDLTVTSDTWFTASFSGMDANADNTADDTVNFVLADPSSNGLYTFLYTSINDTTFGDGAPDATADAAAGVDDARIGANGTLTLDSYGFDASFVSNPGGNGTATDVSIVINAWYTGAFLLDAHADGTADDSVNFVLYDTDSNAVFETLDLSYDSTFGQVSGGLTDGRTLVDGSDDERVTVSGTEVILVPHAIATNSLHFEVSFAPNPAGNGSSGDASIEALRHFEGYFYFDADGNGALDTTPLAANYYESSVTSANNVFFALSDLNSDGVYDSLDLSLGNNTFNQATVLEQTDRDIFSVASGGSTNDERVTSLSEAGADILDLGPLYSVKAWLNSTPTASESDTDAFLKHVALGQTIVYTALESWQIDADGDEQADDHVYFVLSATGSTAVIDTIDISTGDLIFGEGDLSDGAVDFDPADNAEDERFSLTSFPSGRAVRLGTHYFLVEFEPTVNADTDDARITSLPYTGTFPVDVDNDLQDNTIDYVLLSPDSNGLYRVIEIDGDDSGSFSADEVHASAGTRWYEPVRLDQPGGQGGYSATAAVDADTVYVAYYDATSADLKFTATSNAGLDWSAPVRIDQVGDVGRHLAMTAQGARIWIAYYNATSTDLKLARSTDGGSAWTVSTIVASANDVGTFAAVDAIDSTNVFLAYYDADLGDLLFTRSSDAGATWTPPATIDSAGDVGRYGSLAALDRVCSTCTGDDVYVSYYDATNGNLKVARSINGGAWSTATADGSASSVGLYTSITALRDTTPNDNTVSGDTVFVSYYDATNKDLKLARVTNGGFDTCKSVPSYAVVPCAWTVTTVASTGDVGEYSRISASDQATIFIAYYDATSEQQRPKSVVSTDGGLTFSSPADIDSRSGTGRHLALATFRTHSVFAVYYDEARGEVIFARSRLLADLEGHRMSVYYALDPSESGSATLMNGRILTVANVNPAQWMFMIPRDADEGPNIEQSQLRVLLKVPDGARPGYYSVAMKIVQIGG